MPRMQGFVGFTVACEAGEAPARQYAAGRAGPPSAHPLAHLLDNLAADFGSFSAIPSKCSRRSISRQTSSGLTPAAVVQQVGTLADHGGRVAVNGVDNDLDGFFRRVFWPSWRGRAETAGRFAMSPGRDPGPRSQPDKADFEQITHRPNLVESAGKRVNGLPDNEKKPPAG